MTSMTINPHFLAAPIGAANIFRPEESGPRFARLPVSPRNASPVPELTSLYHKAERGPWGTSAYPGNCSGYLIRDLLRYFAPASVFDPMTGSGTCRDVCKDLGIYCWSNDLHQDTDACEPSGFREAFEFAWLHPPYWRQKLYCADARDLSRTPTLEAFLERYRRLIECTAETLKPGGHLAILMGDYCDRQAGYVPLVYYTKRLAFEAGLTQHCTDIIRFSHGATSSRKVYTSKFIPGLHDVCTVFEKGARP